MFMGLKTNPPDLCFPQSIFRYEDDDHYMMMRKASTPCRLPTVVCVRGRKSGERGQWETSESIEIQVTISKIITPREMPLG